MDNMAAKKVVSECDAFVHSNFDFGSHKSSDPRFRCLTFSLGTGEGGTGDLTNQSAIGETNVNSPVRNKWETVIVS